MKVVLDTNAFVSALLSPGGVPGQVLRDVLSKHMWFVSLPLAFEYGAVLSRPKLERGGIGRGLQRLGQSTSRKRL